MSAHDTLKEQFLTRRAHEDRSRWHDECIRASEVLHDHDPELVELAKKYLTVPDDARRAAHQRNFMSTTLRTMQYGYDIPGILGAMYLLVWYRIYKHMDVGVGYCRHDGAMFSIVSCGAAEERAMPYFHSHLDGLQAEYPGAERLTYRRATEVLDFHVARELRSATWIRENEPGEAYGPTEQDALLAALTDELIAEPPAVWRGRRAADMGR